MATNKGNNNWNKLSRAWVNDFTTSPANCNNSTSTIQNAIQRTLPLLFDDTTSGRNTFRSFTEFLIESD